MSNIFLITISLDIIGVIVGLVSIYILSVTRKRVGGVVGSGLSLFIWGILFMISAFVWTIVFSRLKLLPAPPVDIHHLLMSIGMILFVITGMNFAKLYSAPKEM